MNTNRVLFISHEASRSGAPIVLLQLIAWLQQTLNAKFSCVLIRGGGLEKDFAALCPTANLEANVWRKDSFRSRLIRRMKSSAIGEQMFQRSVQQHVSLEPDLIYCNTIVALQALQYLPRLTGRVICHVHELECILRWALSDPDVRKSLGRVDRFIACSQSVADNLSSAHAIPAERIDVVHTFTTLKEADKIDVANRREQLRITLGVRASTLVVGASGTYGWRKGTDLFVQLVSLVKTMQPGLDVHFLWLGGSLENIWGIEFIRDIELADLQEYVTVIPAQKNPMDYFAGLDLFALTSREDPFPLVCLEAAACGVPIVCFERSGGMPELIENDAGAVVPYLDIAALTAKVVELLQDETRRRSYGQNAKQKVRARYDIKVAGPKILDTMRKTLEEPAASQNCTK